MTQRRLTVVIVSVVLLISLASIRRWVWPVTPQINPARFISLGQVLAEETVKAMAGHGRIVAIVNERHQLPYNPLHDELENFQSGLKKYGSVSLAATEVVPVDPNEMVLGSGCSGAQLQAILTKHAAADAIVFFIDLPEWGLLQARGMAPQPGNAKIIVALNGAVPTKIEYGGYFANGFLSVLIGARSAPAQQTTPKNPREWFDRCYQVYTPQNYESLPD